MLIITDERTQAVLNEPNNKQTASKYLDDSPNNVINDETDMSWSSDIELKMQMYDDNVQEPIHIYILNRKFWLPFLRVDERHFAILFIHSFVTCIVIWISLE